jgi:transposase
LAPKGLANLKVLEAALAAPDADLPGPVPWMGALCLHQIARLTEIMGQLAGGLESATRTDEELRRTCPVPGIGPVTAGAMAAVAPDLDIFESGRTCAVSCRKHASGVTLGLVPGHRATGEKTHLRAVSRQQDGPCNILRLAIVGVMSVMQWVMRKGGGANRWLARLVARKSRMAVALANTPRAHAKNVLPGNG